MPGASALRTSAYSALAEELVAQQERAETLDVASVGTASIASSGNVRAMAFSVDSSLLISGGLDERVTVCEATTGRAVRQHKYQAEVRAIAVSPDNTVLAYGGADRRVVLRDLKMGTLLKEIDHTCAVRCIEFAPDGSHFATGGENGRVMLRDTLTGSPLDEFAFSATLGKEGAVESVAFSKDGSHMCTGTSPAPAGGVAASSGKGFESQGKAAVCDARTGDELWEIEFPGKVEVAISPDGTAVAAAARLRIALLSLHRGGSVIWEGTHSDAANNEVHAIAFSPDGSQLVTGGGRVLSLRSVRTGRVLREVRHASSIVCARFSPDGGTLACGGDDRHLTLRAVRTAHVVWPIAEPLDGRSMAVSADGELLAASCATSASLISTKLGTLVLPTGERQEEHTRPTTAVAFSDDRTLLATGSEGGEILLRRSESGSHLAEILRTDTVTALCFSPDGRQLAAGEGHNACVYTLPEPAAYGGRGGADPSLAWEHAHRAMVGCVAFTADASRIAFGVGDTIFVRDAASGAQLEKLPHGCDSAHTLVSALAITPDGRMLASCGTDRMVILYDLATAETLCECEMARPPTCAAFDATGVMLAWGTGDPHGNGFGEVGLLDARSGERLWTHPMPGRVQTVRFGDLYGDLYGRVQTVRFALPPPDSSPEEEERLTHKAVRRSLGEVSSEVSSPPKVQPSDGSPRRGVLSNGGAGAKPGRESSRESRPKPGLIRAMTGALLTADESSHVDEGPSGLLIAGSVDGWSATVMRHTLSSPEALPFWAADGMPAASDTSQWAV